MPDLTAAPPRARWVAHHIARGNGPYLYAADGAELLDATAGGDRVLLGYGWDPLAHTPGGLGRWPRLPLGWGDPAHRLLVDDLTGLCAAEYAVLTPSGESAFEVMLAVCGAGRPRPGRSPGRGPGAVIVVDALDTAWPWVASTGTRRTLQVVDLDADHSLLTRVEKELDTALGPVTGLLVRAAPAAPLDAATLRGLRALCDARGLVFGWDETRSGFGRGGRPLLYSASAVPGARPDVIAVGDSLTAGHAPLGALLTRTALIDTVHRHARRLPEPAPHAAATALAALHTITRQRLIPKAVTDGEFLRSHLAAALGSGVEIGGRGLALTLRPQSTLPIRLGNRIADRAQARGLRVATTPDQAGITLTPPLNCDHDQLEAIAEHAAAAVRDGCSRQTP